MRFAPTLDPASSPAPAAMSVPADTSAVPVAPSLGRRPLPAWVGAFGLTLGQGALALGLALFLALPLVAILAKSVTDANGDWAGLSVVLGIIGADGSMEGAY